MKMTDLPIDTYKTAGCACIWQFLLFCVDLYYKYLFEPTVVVRFDRCVVQHKTDLIFCI